MKQGPSSSVKGKCDSEAQRDIALASLLCPICLHPISYSKKFQCRRCGWMPG